MLKGSFSNDFPKMAIEIREIVIPTFMTNLCNAFFGFRKQFCGMSNPYLNQKAGKCFIELGLKIPAKGGGGQVGHL